MHALQYLFDWFVSQKTYVRSYAQLCSTHFDLYPKKRKVLLQFNLPKKCIHRKLMDRIYVLVHLHVYVNVYACIYVSTYFDFINEWLFCNF